MARRILLVGLPLAGFHPQRGCVLTTPWSPRERELREEIGGLNEKIAELNEKIAEAQKKQRFPWSNKKLLQFEASVYESSVKNAEAQKLQRRFQLVNKNREYDHASADKRCISHNKWSLCPLVNLAMGAHKIYEAIFTDGSQYGVPKERETHFRAWSFIMGVLELTWVGGVVAHLVAEAYFCAIPLTT